MSFCKDDQVVGHIEVSVLTRSPGDGCRLYSLLLYTLAVRI